MQSILIQAHAPSRSAHRATTIGILLVAAFLLANAPVNAQAGAAGLLIPLEVSNNHGYTTSLRIGIHSMATNGIDEALGERELPPVPPAEVYDVRLIGPSSDIALGEGSLFDLRPPRSGGATFSENYRILHQAGEAWPNVTVRLPASLPSGVKLFRIDGKTLEAGDSAVSLLPAATMNISVDFNLTPPTIGASPLSLVFALSDRDSVTPPARGVRITPSVAHASWNASVSERWISIDRTVGAGEYDLQIGINRITFAEGRSSGVVEIRTTGNDEPVLISVVVDMTTPVRLVDVPAGFAIRSISPHPMTSGGTAVVEYSVGVPGPVTITVIDLLGRVCLVPVRNIMHWPGMHSLRLSASDNSLIPGFYFLRLIANGSARIAPLLVR